MIIVINETPEVSAQLSAWIASLTAARPEQTQPPAPAADIGLQTISEFITSNARSGLYPATQGAARALVFHSATNGLEACGAVIRHGRRVLIHPGKFRAWLESGGAKAA
jgi:hypothetical protein